MRAFFMVSQALMPKRCNVLLEAVKELPPFEMLELKVTDYAMPAPVRRRRRPGFVALCDSGMGRLRLLCSGEARA
ncbi:hypothetical protein EMIT048CA2_30426 [Pseudomonas chlororaphis]